MILAISHLGWQAVQIEADNPDKALRLFKSNRDTGLLLTAGFLIDQLIG
jgi:4-hydroxybenzoate polyprenyltransferase